MDRDGFRFFEISISPTCRKTSNRSALPQPQLVADGDSAAPKDPPSSASASASEAARMRPTPCGAGDLPKVDAVVISHNHYDHLDYGSVRELARRSPPPIWFVPLGMKGRLGRAGVRNVVEMDWSEAVALRDDGDRPDLVVSCVPVQHWCKRAPGEVNAGLNQCLWSGWACHAAGTGYFFGGDTGYAGPMFRRIGEALGPFRLAAIPIVLAYHSRDVYFSNAFDVFGK